MDPQAPTPSSQGARCALHAGQPFTAVCKRCGTYMCQVCTESGKFPVCPACRERAGLGAFPYSRNAFTWGRLMGFAWDVYKRNWSTLTLALVFAVTAMALIQGSSFLVQSLFGDQVATVIGLQALLFIPQMLLQSLLTLGMLSLGVRAARGEPLEVMLLVNQWRKLGTFLLQSLLLNALLLPCLLILAAPVLVVVFMLETSPAVAFGTAALLAPLGVFAVAYVSLGLFFSSMEIVAQADVGAVDGIKNAWAIARGQRLAILLCLIILGGVALAGFMLCMIGLLFSLGYACVLYACVYLTLRNGAEGLATR